MLVNENTYTYVFIIADCCVQICIYYILKFYFYKKIAFSLNLYLCNFVNFCTQNLMLVKL